MTILIKAQEQREQAVWTLPEREDFEAEAAAAQSLGSMAPPGGQRGWARLGLEDVTGVRWLGGGLVAELCLTLATPWTVAH